MQRFDILVEEKSKPKQNINFSVPLVKTDFDAVISISWLVYYGSLRRYFSSICVSIFHEYFVKLQLNKNSDRFFHHTYVALYFKLTNYNLISRSWSVYYGSKGISLQLATGFLIHDWSCTSGATIIVPCMLPGGFFG